MRASASWGLLAALALAAPTLASAQVVLAPPQVDGREGPPDGWTLETKKGSAQVTTQTLDGVTGVCFTSESASFAIERDVSIKLVEPGVLRWRWRVEGLPRNADVRDPGRNDQAAQLLVAYRRVGVTWAISYVWDTNAPVGTTTDESFLAVRLKAHVVASGPDHLGEWIEVERDVRADFEQLHGRTPSEIEGVRFQINSQHTGSRARSCIQRIEFVPR